MSTENWVVVATMGVYLLFMLWIGRRASHRVSDLDSYPVLGVRDRGRGIRGPEPPGTLPPRRGVAEVPGRFRGSRPEHGAFEVGVRSGPLAWLTDGTLLVVTAIVLAASAYMLTKLVRYLQRGMREMPEAQVDNLARRENR